MKKSFLIGIPVRDFVNPMSRLSEVLSKDQRIKLSKGLLLNLIDVFQDSDSDIYVVSNDIKVKNSVIRKI
jgi:2-phospho-L-lactate guanylyltransferase (CobY/MobA/RfbA family)